MLIWCVPGNTTGEERLENFLKHLRNMTGHFTQTVTVNGKESASQAASGTFALSRPGKFKWEIQKPDYQSIVSNGATVWIYDKGLEQVTIQPLSNNTPIGILGVLLGNNNLKKDFEIRECVYKGYEAVELIPKGEAGFTRAVLAFANDLIREVVISDAFGQESRYVFSSINAKATFKQNTFEFKPPAGVDIIENR